MSSQSYNELERFCANFDLLLSNINNFYPTCAIFFGDFNAKCSKWCAPDKSNTAGIEPDNITTTSGYNQMIDKPTRCINELSSCIDLIFSSNVDLMKNCGVEQSLYETCHHNIIYGTLNFNIPLLVPYFREIWDYKDPNIECIHKSINNFDWTRAFQNRNRNDQYRISTETLFNIHAFFVSGTLISNARLKLAITQANAKQHLRLNFCSLENIHILHPRYFLKLIGDIPKNKPKKSVSAFMKLSN